MSVVADLFDLFAPLGESVFLRLCAGVLMALVAAGAVLATVPRRFPGPVGRERRGLDAGRVGRAFALGVSVAVPAATVFGVMLLVAPPRAKVVLTLHSRTRPPSMPAPGPGFLPVSTVNAVDFGPVVDDALRRLERAGASEWVVASPESRRAISEACMEAVGAVALEPGEVRLPTAPSTPGVLPLWVVESVEISVAQLLRARERVEGIYVLNGPRRDAMDGWTLAQSAWSRQHVHLAEANGLPRGGLHVRRLGGATVGADPSESGVVVNFEAVIDGTIAPGGSSSVDVRVVVRARRAVSGELGGEVGGPEPEPVTHTITIEADNRDRRAVNRLVSLPLAPTRLNEFDLFVRDESGNMVAPVRQRLAPPPPPRLAGTGPLAARWDLLLQGLGEGAEAWGALRRELVEAGTPLPVAVSEGDAEFVVWTSVDGAPEQALVAIAANEALAQQAIEEVRGAATKHATLVPGATTPPPGLRIDASGMGAATALSLAEVPVWVRMSDAAALHHLNDAGAMTLATASPIVNDTVRWVPDRSLKVPVVMERVVEGRRVVILQLGIDLDKILPASPGAASGGAGGSEAGVAAPPEARQYDPVVTVGLARALAWACRRTGDLGAAGVLDAVRDDDSRAQAGPVFTGADRSRALAERIATSDGVGIVLIAGSLALFAVAILRSAGQRVTRGPGGGQA
jgi:hypothetical protein